MQVGYSYFSCPGVVYWRALAVDVEGQSPFKAQGMKAGISNWNLDVESVALIPQGTQAFSVFKSVYFIGVLVIY